ncbi:MAG: MFS transporter [bacterium]
MRKSLYSAAQGFRIRFTPLENVSRLLPLIFPLAALSVTDSILSYAVPVYAQKLFVSDFLAGTVISVASLASLSFDYASHKLLGNRSFAYFIKITFILSVIFSLLLGLSFVNRYVFILAMVIWGFYYETLAFSSFKFIKKLERTEYTNAWAVITILRACLYTLGPLLATYLLAYYETSPIYICGIFALIAYLIYQQFAKNRCPESPSQITALNRPKEFKIWWVLLKRVYPIWLLYFVLSIIDAGFWTVGIFMAQNFASESPLAKLIIPVYMLPAIIFSPLSQTVSARLGKKCTAIICSGLGSFFLLLIGNGAGLAYILPGIFLYSVLTSISFPAIAATFEDYISRLHDFDSDLIGLGQASPSLAYIIGPIICGYLAVQLSEQRVFAVLGALLAAVSITAFLITPKKIRMPQTELSKSC